MANHYPTSRRREWRLALVKLFSSVAILLIALTGSISASAEESEVSDEWIWVVSQNFRILTNAPPELVQGIAVNLERFRHAFAELSPGMSLRSPIPVRIVAFASHRTYAPYKNPPIPGILGQFVRNLDGHYLTFHAGASSHYAVDYHEYVHYLVDGNLPSVPRWFNEGLAEYYSTFKAGKETVTVGLPVERHLRWFKADAAEQSRSLSYDFTLNEVIGGQAAHDHSKVGGFYAFSWALVHYLLSGSPERLAQTAEFLALLGEGEEAERAFESAFDARMSDLESEVKEYVEAGKFKHATLRSPSSGALSKAFRARRADVEIWLGDLAAQIGNLDQARRHFREAREIAPGRPEPLAGLGFLADYEKRYDESSILFADAGERVMRDPRSLLRHGRHQLNELLPEESEGLVAGGRIVASSAFARSMIPFLEDPLATEQAEAADKAATGALESFKRALQVSPGHAGAQVHLGIAHLFADVEPDAGIEALQDVRQWLPQDPAIAFYLLQLHLKKKEFGEARRLLTEAIGDAYPELTLQAEEEIERARLVHRAGLALDQGEIESAKRFFDEAISITSDLDLRERMTEILLAFERGQEERGQEEEI